MARTSSTERRRRIAGMGMCIDCGDPQVDARRGLMRCKACQDAVHGGTAKRQAERLADGLCMYCGLNKPIAPGRRSCWSCRKRRAAKGGYRRPGATAGPCARCGENNPRRQGHRVCWRCHRLDGIVPMRLQRARQACGGCVRCGKPRGADGTATRCRRCADMLYWSEKGVNRRVALDALATLHTGEW